MATFTVRPDDTFNEIADILGVTPDELHAVNPQIQNRDRLMVGDQLAIPEPKGAGEPDPSRNVVLDTILGQPPEDEIPADRLPAPPEERMGEGNIAVATNLQRGGDPDTAYLQRGGDSKIAYLLEQAVPGFTKYYDPGGGPVMVPATEAEVQAAEDEERIQADIGRQFQEDLFPGETSLEPGIKPPEFPLEPPEEKVEPAVPREAATEAVEPDVPAPKQDITVDEAKAVVAPTVAPALDGYRQYASDLLGIKPKDVTITRNEIRQLESRITGYNDRIQAIAEEKAKPFFGKEDTGRMFLAAIAAGLGAYAAAMTGTRNFALDTINQAIERDLQAQRESKDFRIRDLEQQRLLLLERRGELVQFARDQVASNVALAQNQGMAQLNLAKLNQTQQQLEQQLAKIQADYQQALAKALVDVRNQYVEGYVPGLGYTPLKGEGLKIAIKAANEFQTTENDMKPLIEEALMLIEENSAAIKIPGSDERARMQQLLDQVRLTYKNNVAKIGAAATASEMQEFLNGIVPNFRAGATLGEAVFGTVKVKLNGILKDLEQKRRNIIKQYQFSEGNQSAAGSETQAKIKGLTPGTSEQ